MKKLLSLLTSIGLVATAASAVVGCGTKQDSTDENLNHPEAFFEKASIELSDSNPQRTIKVSFNSQLKQKVKNTSYEIRVETKGSNSNAVDTSYKDKKLTLTLNHWKNDAPVNVKIALLIIDKNDSNDILGTSDTLSVTAKSLKTPRFVDLNLAKNLVKFNQNTGYEQWIQIEHGTDIDVNSFKLKLTSDDNQSYNVGSINKLINFETRTKNDGKDYLVISLNNSFDWSKAINATYSLSFNTLDGFSKVTVNAPLKIISDTNQVARSVSFDSELENVVFNQNLTTQDIPVNYGSDVNLNSVKLISDNPNLNLSIVYNNGKFTLAINKPDFTKTEFTNIYLQFKLISRPTQIVKTNSLIVSTQLSDVAKTLSWSTNQPILLSENNNQSNLTFNLGAGIDESSVQISKIEVDSPNNKLSSSDFNINDQEFIDPVNVNNGFKISANNDAYNYGFILKIILNYKLKGSEETLVSNPIVINGQSNEESRQAVISSSQSDESKTITSLDLNQKDDSTSFYILSKNENFSDIDWNTFSYKINNTSTAHVYEDIIKSVDFIPSSDDFGGQVLINVKKNWQYTVPATFSLDLTFKLKSDSTKTVSLISPTTKVEQSDYYYWNTSSEANEIIEVTQGSLYGYNVDQTYIDLGHVIGDGINTSTFKITDNRGRDIDPDDLSIAYSYTPDVYKLGLGFNNYLYINTTKTYIDSLFTNKLDAQKGNMFTYQIHVIDRTGQVQTRSVLIGFKDEFWTQQ